MYSYAEKQNALRFHYTMTEFGYWDIELKALRHLIAIDLISHPGCGRYAMTDKLNNLVSNENAATHQNSLATSLSF